MDTFTRVGHELRLAVSRLNDLGLKRSAQWCVARTDPYQYCVGATDVLLMMNALRPPICDNTLAGPPNFSADYQLQGTSPL